jgi:putative restriction endonuclease
LFLTLEAFADRIATGGHPISTDTLPKKQNGTDDPRNGLTLCRAHHWAFDSGLFTLASDYTIVLSPMVRRAESRKFELQSLEGTHIQVPNREVILPHPKAIEWHCERVFRA